jgi:transcriptional regulator with XRE-family HTH domain
MDLAAQLREARKRDKRTTPELAIAAELHRVNLYQFLKGTRKLQTHDLERLAAALGYQVTLQRTRKR